MRFNNITNASLAVDVSKKFHNETANDENGELKEIVFGSLPVSDKYEEGSGCADDSEIELPEFGVDTDDGDDDLIGFIPFGKM